MHILKKWDIRVRHVLEETLILAYHIFINTTLTYFKFGVGVFLIRILVIFETFARK